MLAPPAREAQNANPTLQRFNTCAWQLMGVTDYPMYDSLKTMSMVTVPSLQSPGQPARGLKFALALLLVTAFGTPPAPAQFLYRQLNLAEMTQRAAIIAQGKVTAVRYEPLPGYAHIDTVLVTLQVAQALKGEVGQTYTFREFIPPGQSRMVHKRRYLVGQQLLLFLATPSQYGLSSPLGRQQGTFHITEDSRGNKYIANEAGNFHLFAGVSQAVNEAGGTLSEQPAELKALASGPVPLTKFVSIIKQLRNLPGAE